ncbi:MAG: clostripain-related cysteine peptidase, partial [Bdellovibrionales bacterium]|nr:clostripain-related cysteine peptidase [Bdellovibrionales bacterium]
MAKKLGLVALFATYLVIVLVGGSIFGSPAFATASQPKWFPAKSCRELWGNRDLAKYDPAKDANITSDGNRGYDTYLARLKKSGIDRRTCFKDWTVLVYMAGDNDLSPYAIWDLEEMEGRFESGRYAGSTLKSDLIVQADTAGATGLRRLHMFQRDDQPYSAATSIADFKARGPETVRSPIVDLLPDQPPSKQGLQDFLQWGVRQYPAQRYMVVVWGHGQGWLGAPTEITPIDVENLNKAAPAGQLAAALGQVALLPQPPTATASFGGIAIDPATGNGLSIDDLNQALTATVNVTLEGRPIDVYASDACLMQMAEVAREISDTSRYIVGSAQVQSYLGLPYRRLMYELNTGRFLSGGALVGKTDEALLVAKMLPLLTEQSLDPVRGQQGRAEPKAVETFTMSALSTAALKQRLIPSLTDFSKALLAYLEEDPIRGFSIGAVIKAAPSFMGGGKELGSFLSLIEIGRLEDQARRGDLSPGSKKLANSISELKLALDETVIERRLGTRYQTVEKSFHLLGYRGVGIWIPNGDREFKKRS